MSGPLIFLLVITLWCGLVIAAMKWDVSSHGGPDPFLFQFPLVFVLLAVLFIVPIGIVRMVSQKTRLEGFLFTAAGMTVAVVCIASLRIAHAERMDSFRELGEKFVPLITAIGDYEKDHGEYPWALHELVPGYIQEIPETGMKNYPEYRYFAGKGARDYEENPWVIVMNSGYGMGFDLFMYFPLQNYPERGYGGSIERLGDWAYVHE